MRINLEIADNDVAAFLESLRNFATLSARPVRTEPARMATDADVTERRTALASFAVRTLARIESVDAKSALRNAADTFVAGATPEHVETLAREFNAARRAAGFRFGR